MIRVLCWLVLLASAVSMVRADVELKPVVLGGDADETLLARVDGRWQLRGGGREAYMGRDEGTFAFTRVSASDFDFTARLVRFDAASGNPKIGIALRTSTSGVDRSISLRFDGHAANRCVQWFYRHRVAVSAHDGARAAFLDGLARDFNRGEGLWLRIERRYPRVRLLASRDGQQWTDVAADHHLSMVDQEVLVGLQVTAGGDGKAPVTAVFDEVRLEVVNDDPARSEQRLFPEASPSRTPWRMHLIQATGVREKGEDAAAFLLMPRDLDPRRIRAILLSAGSKELCLDGQDIGWDSGTGGRRKPRRMDDWQGTIDLEGLDEFHAALEPYQVVRVGGVFEAKHYEKAIQQLADATGIRHLPNLPVLITGASFAGGQTASAARAFPAKTIAAAPVIIGMAGAAECGGAYATTPLLHVYGSNDGTHSRDAGQWTPKLRSQHALWANAPMWHVAHRQHAANAVIYPYFLECLRLRLPEDADATAGPVALRDLNEADGWLGLTDTWTGTMPTIVPFREKPDAADAVWLPSELAARVWQAFVARDSRAVIHFPRYDGTSTYGGPRPEGWHNTRLVADEPFHVLASGPVGRETRVEWFVDGQPLTLLEGQGGYFARAKGLEAGLRSLWCVVTADGVQHVSRPSLVLVETKQR